ncbi:MAG: hypothetical protein ABI867_36980 [Kofleriaceae bacterium]
MRTRRWLLATSALSATMACAPDPAPPPCPAVAPPPVTRRIVMPTLDVTFEAMIDTLSLKDLLIHGNPKGSTYDANAAVRRRPKPDK